MDALLYGKTTLSKVRIITRGCGVGGFQCQKFYDFFVNLPPTNNGCGLTLYSSAWPALKTISQMYSPTSALSESCKHINVSRPATKQWYRVAMSTQWQSSPTFPWTVTAILLWLFWWMLKIYETAHWKWYLLITYANDLTTAFAHAMYKETEKASYKEPYLWPFCAWHLCPFSHEKTHMSLRIIVW